MLSDCGKSMCHRLVVGDRWPTMTVLFSYVMVAVVLSKVAVQPESQSCPIDRREFCREGIVCASCAEGGNDG